MIKYYCNNCKIYCETSVCTICAARTELKSRVYWCENCNIPIYEEVCPLCNRSCIKSSTDLRPVFPEERLLIEILMGKPFEFLKSSVWNGSGNRYIVDGKKLDISIETLMKNDIEYIIGQLNKYKSKNTYEYFNEYIELFKKANKDRYNFLVSEATNFIIDQKIKYGDDETFVSFSGGKDSTVVSDLVIKALGMPNIIHIFGDTTLEFPTTIDYVNRFKLNHNRTPLLSARNKEKNFYDMCEVVGPPSRVMRWCCTVFKTGAITKKINSTFKNKNKILTFYGIRRSESASRNKYERVSYSPKISKQHVSSPIIDWYDFDIWLYITMTNIDFNDAYRLGYSRVGCWCCPNNSTWAQYISKIYMPGQSQKWRAILIDFAKKIGKEDAEVYVDDEKWKARQGGNGIKESENIFVNFKPCSNDNESFNYELKREINEELYELFKPFGWINNDMGNKRIGQVYIVDKLGNPLIILQGKIGSTELKVTVIKLPKGIAKTLKEIKQKIDCQITKYQLCLGCLGCESACKHDAIVVNRIAHKNELIINKSNSTYKIIDEKCIRCGKCINNFEGGCYMRKVLMTKRGEKSD